MISVWKRYINIYYIYGDVKSEYIRVHTIIIITPLKCMHGLHGDVNGKESEILKPTQLAVDYTFWSCAQTMCTSQSQRKL